MRTEIAVLYFLYIRGDSSISVSGELAEMSKTRIILSANDKLTSNNIL